MQPPETCVQSLTELAEAPIPPGTDPRDAAEMCECQERIKRCPDCIQRQLVARKTRKGIVYDLRLDVPEDFRLTEETWLSELEPFGLPINVANSLERFARVFTVGEVRRWLVGGEKVSQVDGRRIKALRAAIEAAERWGSQQTG